MASYVTPGKRLDQSDVNSVYMKKGRDVMASSMWNTSNGSSDTWGTKTVSYYSIFHF